MTEELKKLRGDVIAYRPSFAKVLINGDRFGAEGAIYLQQLIYWCDKGTRKDGFIYKSKDEIYEETGITPRVQDRIRRVLVSLGCLETKTLRANGSPTLHYKLNLQEIIKKFVSDYAVSDIPPRQRDDSNMPNGVMEHPQRAHSITETTTETTTEITTNWQEIVLYFYNKVSPSTSPKDRFRNTTKAAAAHLLSLHSKEVIMKKIDALSISPDRRFITRFETFCNKYDTLGGGTQHIETIRL